MQPKNEPSSDWHILQIARADFIISAIRDRLPPSSLWHEKRYIPGQLESLVIASTGGIYSVDTFDTTTNDNTDGVTVGGEIRIRVSHDPRTHRFLADQDIEQLLHTASSDFDSAVGRDRKSATTAFRRVTCVMEFNSPTDDFNQFGNMLFRQVADKLGYHLTYIPFIVHDLFLPDSDFYNIHMLLDPARAAGEFIFENPLTVETVTTNIQNAVQSTKSLLVPGIHGIMPKIDRLHDLHFIGRYY